MPVSNLQDHSFTQNAFTVHIVPGFFHDLIKHVRPFNVYYTCEHEFKLMTALILHFFSVAY